MQWFYEYFLLKQTYLSLLIIRNIFNIKDHLVERFITNFMFELIIKMNNEF